MAITSDELTQRILDFMVVIHECYSDTNYANDRSVFAQDLAAAMDWIVDLRNGTANEVVIGKILGPDTDKIFGEYYRGGVWGERATEGLEQLKNHIKG